MANNHPVITTLRQLLDYDAQRFSCAEVLLKTSLQRWINSTESVKLKLVMERCIDFTIQHTARFESFFDEEGMVALSTVNPVMEALIKETDEKLALCAEPSVKDAVLLACVQTISHYKMSLYGTAAAFATELAMEKYAVIFHQACINEKQIDNRLTQLAAFEINAAAKLPALLQE